MALVDVGLVFRDPVKEGFRAEVVSLGEHFLVDLDALLGLDYELHHLEEGIDELAL